jgi:hypothetical protein
VATYDFTFYTAPPTSYGFPGGTGTFTYTGPSEKTGSGQITDTGSGSDPDFFTDNDGATGTFTVGGNTSTNVSTEADGGYLLRDTVTGEEFRVVGFDVIGDPAAGTYTMSEQALVPGRQYQVLQFEDDPSEGGTGARYAEVVCYAAGTLIDTPDGPRAVEALEPGDPVMTLHHGAQTIRWTHRADHPLEDAAAEARPLQIKAGALDHNLPARDLIVSPHHRIVVGGRGQLQKVFASEAFAPAKSLTAVPGIRHMKGKARITWFHFACDRHEVVIANNCLAESLLLGPMVVNGLTAAERREVIDIFGPAPTPDTAQNGPPAMECLAVGASRRQLAKVFKKRKQPAVRQPLKREMAAELERHQAAR